MVRSKQRLTLSLLLVTACHTTPKRQEGKGHGEGPIYMKGRGIAKYHDYDSVPKCKTAFGLDPEAFDMMVTAASMRITERFPAMGKAGRRDGPYDHRARCFHVRSLENQKSVMVRAIDKCCGDSLTSERTHQLDLARQAFAQIAPLAQGNVRIEWMLVDCPPGLQVSGDGDVCDDNYYFQRK